MQDSFLALVRKHGFCEQNSSLRIDLHRFVANPQHFGIRLEVGSIVQIGGEAKMRFYVGL